MNIVLLIIDTLRYDYVGANGNEWIETPNMDRLAAESFVFDECFAASWPTIPHRTDVITGRYGEPFHAWQPLPHAAVALPRWLAEQAGYATQFIHDTPHLVNGGHNFDYPFHCWTQVRGAEVDRAWFADELRMPDNWALHSDFDCLGELGEVRPQSAVHMWANRKRKTHEDWNCMKLFTTAAEFVRDNARRDNFFLWLDCFDPHEPWDAPPEFVLKYDTAPGYDGRIDPRGIMNLRSGDMAEPAVSHIKASYAANVSWMDHCLGRFLDALDETGLSENTALILTSDHGTRLFEYGGFGKSMPVREQEAHVPLMVRRPGGAVGRRGGIVQPQDIFATVCGMAGCGRPDGVEAFDVLAPPEAERPRRIALSGQFSGFNGEREYVCTVLDGEWCLEATVAPERSRLQRMGGTEDVAADHPRVVRKLWSEGMDELARRGADARIMAWIRSGGDGPFPADCPLHDGWPGPEGYTAYFGRLAELGPTSVS